MDHEVEIICPFCFEPATIWIDPETEGELVEDCQVCCHPWRLVVRRDRRGRPEVSVGRAY